MVKREGEIGRVGSQHASMATQLGAEVVHLGRQVASHIQGQQLGQACHHGHHMALLQVQAEQKVQSLLHPGCAVHQHLRSTGHLVGERAGAAFEAWRQGEARLHVEFGGSLSGKHDLLSEQVRKCNMSKLHCKVQKVASGDEMARSVPVRYVL